MVHKLPDGQLEVRKIILDEDGDPVYHRFVIIPGGVRFDEDVRVKTIAQRYHTTKVIVAWWVEERKRQRQLTQKG